jgi:predicted ATPase
MRVEQISFTGFKSLHDLTLTLGDLTVIIGPNGAGKSNLLAGLAFLSDLYRVGLEDAVEHAGGYEMIAFRRSGESQRSLGFKLLARLDRSDLEAAADGDTDGYLLPEFLDVSHEISVRAADGDPISIFGFGSESLRVRDEAGREWLSMVQGESRDSVLIGFGDPPVRDAVRRFLPAAFFEERGLPGESLFEAALGLDAKTTTSVRTLARYFSPLRTMWRSVISLRVLQPVPHLCRQAGVPRPNAFMSPLGENLPAVADHLRRHDPEAWIRVQEAMFTAVPALIDVEVVLNDERKLALRFNEKGIARPWTSDEISDGTIQFLALVVALYDRRVPLLAVEEPENALHPWTLREFIKLCHYEKGKQVVLTTHSPALIDFVPGEWVHLMWREGGKSKIGRMIDLDPDVRKIWESGEVSLFEMYDAGVIRQATPGF